MAQSDETLAEVLREQIMLGAYSPGQKLSESKLAEHYKVSRNTLREAFRVLAEQGLIEHVPHRGVTVTSPSMSDVIDIYRGRRVIELGVIGNASPLHPGVGDMRRAVEEAESAAKNTDWVGVGSANMAFHLALVSLSDSPRLIRLHRLLAAELRLAFLVIDNAEALHRPFVMRNRLVLDALEQSGPSAAKEELEKYLLDSERTVLGVYSRIGRS